MPDKSTYLTVAIDAAKAAEDVIRKHYAPDISVTLKADESPVTIADQEAERAVMETIRRAFPDHGFLGEETGDASGNAEYTWIIDPIDGTRNFIRQVPLFGTLIALRKGGDIIVGVSNMPMLGELIYAEKGKGAYNKSGERLSVSARKTLKDAYLSYGGINQFIKKDLLQNLLDLIGETGRNRDFGDCWQYHLLAEGKIDVVVDPKVNIWDVAPAMIILQEAGGKITDMKGNVPRGTNFVAVATNGLVHEEALAHFSK
jgi:histidinol-phosphatase